MYSLAPFAINFDPDDFAVDDREGDNDDDEDDDGYSNVSPHVTSRAV